MNAIANFRKRREAERTQQKPTATETTATPAPENEALHLLAYLLCCDVEEALEVAREAVKKKIHFLNFTIGVDTGEGQDKTAQATVTNDDQGNIASIIDHAAELEDSAATVSDAAETALDAADKVSESADKVSSAAGDLDDAVTNLAHAAGAVDQSTNDLAYTADDLGQVAAELKEATAELKKPSAAQESSHGAKAAAPKSSSKKSG
ncbi:hypothetical protein CKQ84_22140 [Shewanella sp. WE21]|uniref:hypothetical protein n=1 Tax=Shewanella sp. WE21 TaxID=2029986 RepID=UPI000CF6A8CD|nr:hypothetical protein [Shewanella sp. WE21]AVI68315.1 hypothetical protein CKQ84_22140 [Shewanella sp. WE21]